jgi:hypothetical protein
MPEGVCWAAKLGAGAVAKRISMLHGATVAPPLSHSWATFPVSPTGRALLVNGGSSGSTGSRYRTGQARAPVGEQIQFSCGILGKAEHSQP